MGQKFLIDTNVLIDFQTKILPQRGFEHIAKIIDDNFTVSFISYIEFLGYKDATASMEMFMTLAHVIEIDKTITDKTIQLRKSRKIMLPDAIIAATAIVCKLTLVTNNTKDFANIKGLKTLNPYKL